MILIPGKLVLHEQVKHIEVGCHFIREKVSANLVYLVYLMSESQ